ncbi:hypothetical protein [Actinacidiphila sp. bgisy144]|uniref:hypothetical protein n=1 Tax=Actinacidiphila sp. bgisy144 TaxID=3413791 RepID=UPI003EBF6653
MDHDPSHVPPALTALDQQVELVVRRTVDTLWQQLDDGVLDAPHAALAQAHHELAEAEIAVTFYRVRLADMVSGVLPVDANLLEAIDRTADSLESAMIDRDNKQQAVADALRPIEAAHFDKPVSSADFVALQAIGQGADLRQDLRTGLRAVSSASLWISYAHLLSLEAAGFVQRDTSRPLYVSQPLSLTDAGRAVLTSSRPVGKRHSRSPAPAYGAFPYRRAVGSGLRRNH